MNKESKYRNINTYAERKIKMAEIRKVERKKPQNLNTNYHKKNKHNTLNQCF